MPPCQTNYSLKGALRDFLDKILYPKVRNVCRGFDLSRASEFGEEE